MSKFDTLKDYQSASAHQKLAAIGNEFTTPIAVVNGYAIILKKSFRELNATNNLPPDWDEWIDKIIVASEDMKEILKIMTSNPE